MFGLWDILFISIITIQAVIVSYVFHPKWKALMITLPIPFPFIYLAVGHPINATNIIGFLLLFIFTQGVRIFYKHLRIPIILAIVLSATIYCLLGMLVLNILMFNEMTFWVSVFSIFIGGIILRWVLPIREEQGGRTQLPLLIKLPITIALVIFLVLIKGQLGGFATLFPMVGVFAAFEARRSLWTMGRQIPVVMIIQVPMMVVIYLCEPSMGSGWALLLGGLTFLVGLVIMQYSLFFGKASQPISQAVERGLTKASQPISQSVE